MMEIINFKKQIESGDIAEKVSTASVLAEM